MCHQRKYSQTLAFLLLLVLLLFSGSFLSADVVLTDEEYQVIETLLIESKVEITLLKKASIELKSELKITRSQLTDLQIEQALLKLNYQLQLKSLEELNKRVSLIWLDRVGFAIGGTLLGIGIDELAHLGGR